MKRIITKFIIIFTIIVCTLNAITLTTFANIDKKNLYSKGDCGRLLKKGDVVVKTYIVVYNNNGKEYPAYCQDKNKAGVDDNITYDVTLDGIIKNIPIYDTSTIETVSTVGKTSNLSFDEKIDTSSIDINTLKLSINYGATLLSYLLDGMEYVASFPYGCSEQITSALMPHIYLKKLYESA